MKYFATVPRGVLDAGYLALLALLVVILAYVANRIGNRLIDQYLNLRERREEKASPELLSARKRAYTAAAILRHTLRYAIVVIAAYAIIVAFTITYPRTIGVLTGLGVAGVAVAFGAQAILRDIIAGFFIIFENQYGVGDAVKIRMANYEVTGIVEEFSLRFTRLMDVAGHARFIPNGGILGVDRYATGYAKYRMDYLLPAGSDEQVEGAISKMSRLYGGHPLLLGPISIDQLSKADDGLLVTTVVKTIPGSDLFVEKLSTAVSSELQKTLGLVEPPLSSHSELNEEALSLYEKSIFLG